MVAVGNSLVNNNSSITTSRKNGPISTDVKEPLVFNRKNGQLLAAKIDIPSDEIFLSFINSVPEKLFLNFGKKLSNLLGLKDEVSSVDQVLNKLSDIYSQGGQNLNKTVELFVSYSKRLGSPATTDQIKQTLASLSNKANRENLIHLAKNLHESFNSTQSSLSLAA